MKRFHCAHARWSCKGFTGRVHAGHAKVSLEACTLAMQRLHWAHACWPCKGFTRRIHAGHGKVSLGTCMQAMQRFHWAQARWPCKGFTGHIHASHAKFKMVEQYNPKSTRNPSLRPRRVSFIFLIISSYILYSIFGIFLGCESGSSRWISWMCEKRG
jgi:hypothetical protein